ncbi:MAG: bacterial translation initiation factor 2 (bIF-2) [Acidobacteria bacterium]|nr:bacterial translation initiation factor 2 (bIF-2) [Acidobacteriota bacterium]
MRINELARELEVKAKAILDYLAELGIEDKRSHSSSVEGELAERVKAHFREAPEAPAPEPSEPSPVAAPLEKIPAGDLEPPSPTTRARTSLEAETKGAPARTEPGRAPSAPLSAAPAAPTARKAAPGEAPAPPKRSFILRPPVRSHGEPQVAPQPPGRPILEPKAPPPVVPHFATVEPPPVHTPIAASGKAAAPAAPAQRPITRAPARPMPPLGPAKPGEPIYRRPPGRPAKFSKGPGTVPGVVPPPESVRRGPHPVRGRTHPGAARTDRDRRGEEIRERALRVVQPPRPAPQPIRVDREVTVTEGVTVKDLSEKLGVKARDLIRRLLDMGVLATINQNLDPTLAEQVAQSFGARTRVVSFEEEAVEKVEIAEAPEKRIPRAPVVTVMGHVDHGKTSLLDAIRETNVTAQEAGGITQHIGAYAVAVNSRQVVFLDTPGHEAFTRMRARGAKVTDVVILVVAADDGVMPQTIEAINHARAAKVPILVVINKVDKPGALPERVKKQLSDLGLVAEDWGGDTVMVEVSAKQRTNLKLLLEMILLVADIQDLRANPERAANGTVLEAKLDRGRGPVCTVLVQNGTLRVGDSFLVGAVFGKVRAMLDHLGKPVDDAPPSTPVEVLGLQSLPQAGDAFQVVPDPTKAKQIALYREAKRREQSLTKSSRLTLEHLHDALKAGAVKELALVLKADVQGSVEVLAETLTKLGDQRVRTKVIHAGVGAITISDVLLASASNSIIIGFNVRPERKASELAQQEEVEIRLHTVIYEVIDEMKKAMMGLLEPTFRETVVGKAEVRQTFRVAKVGTIAGSVVSEGRFTGGASARLLRDNVVVYSGRISSLRRFKDDVSEVRSGLECGIGLENYSDIKAGDVIEAFVTEKLEHAKLGSEMAAPGSRSS